MPANGKKLPRPADIPTIAGVAVVEGLDTPWNQRE
jgi:hypothetical protein